MKITLRALATGLLLSTSAAALAQPVPIVLPGAPGTASRVIDEDEAIRLSDTRFSPADVKFMQDMIVHHQQAVDLATLVEGRSNHADLAKIAGRIDASQADEITFMRDWLAERGQPAKAMHHAGMDHAAHHLMMGMATPEQMAELATLEGTAFDRMFLQLMVRHHEGAIDMVETLHRQPGTAYDPVMFEFSNDVVKEQKAEIDRMNGILAALSSDPRASLAAGFRDAEEAISNLRLVTALPKPTGFFDPENPAQLAPLIEEDEETGDAAELVDASRPDIRDEEDEDGQPRFGERGSLLSFANTDMAFSRDLL
ncbi:MAG: DUF305 domain-containing protein, partial [Qipengyuania sp.]